MAQTNAALMGQLNQQKYGYNLAGQGLAAQTQLANSMIQNQNPYGVAALALGNCILLIGGGPMNSPTQAGGGIDTSAFQGLLAEGGASAPFADFDVEQELINIYRDPNTPDEQKRQILGQLGGIKEASADNNHS